MASVGNLSNVLRAPQLLTYVTTAVTVEPSVLQWRTLELRVRAPLITANNVVIVATLPVAGLPFAPETLRIIMPANVRLTVPIYIVTSLTSCKTVAIDGAAEEVTLPPSSGLIVLVPTADRTVVRFPSSASFQSMARGHTNPIFPNVDRSVVQNELDGKGRVTDLIDFVQGELLDSDGISFMPVPIAKNLAVRDTPTFNRVFKSDEYALMSDIAQFNAQFASIRALALNTADFQPDSAYITDVSVEKTAAIRGLLDPSGGRVARLPISWKAWTGESGDHFAFSVPVDASKSVIMINASVVWPGGATIDTAVPTLINRRPALQKFCGLAVNRAFFVAGAVRSYLPQGVKILPRPHPGLETLALPAAGDTTSAIQLRNAHGLASIKDVQQGWSETFSFTNASSDAQAVLAGQSIVLLTAIELSTLPRLSNRVPFIIQQRFFTAAASNDLLNGASLLLRGTAGDFVYKYAGVIGATAYYILDAQGSLEIGIADTISWTQAVYVPQRSGSHLYKGRELRFLGVAGVV